MPDFLITRFQGTDTSPDYPATRAELDIRNLLSGGGTIVTAATARAALGDWFGSLPSRARARIRTSAEKFVVVEIGAIVGIELTPRSPTTQTRRTYPA